MSRIEFLRPDWDAPDSVRAAFTLRGGGISRAPFDSLNLGASSGDEPAAVAENRRRLRNELKLPEEPLWLEQVHGIDVVNLDSPIGASPLRADAAVSRKAGRVCAVRVADCMPVLFASQDGAAVGAAHAGWRGLANGVLEATVTAMRVEPGNLSAWMGPCIGAADFEVGHEVRAAFIAYDAQATEAFAKNARGRWQCDLYTLARLRLAALGVRAVSGGGWSTFGDVERFYSYRRDGQTGRMAALIWIEPI